MFGHLAVFNLEPALLTDHKAVKRLGSEKARLLTDAGTVGTIVGSISRERSALDLLVGQKIDIWLFDGQTAFAVVHQRSNAVDECVQFANPECGSKVKNPLEAAGM
jgi:hypothetical protein